MTKIPIIDGHIDVMENIIDNKIIFDKLNKNGHVDLPRLKSGNILAAFFAIFTENSHLIKKREYTDLLLSLINDYKNSLHLIRTYKDIDVAISSHKIGVVIHFEGADGIKPDLSNLKEFYEKGLRSIGITWSNSNLFGQGILGDNSKGLSAEGIKLVNECNRQGIIIDVSHLNEKSFWDVINHTQRPIIASHSNCYSICQDIRNLKDEQIKAIATKGGLIGISINPVFVKNLNLKNGEKIPIEYDKVSLDEIVKHIEYIKNLVGIDGVGLGSDFDGGPVPTFLNDISKYPKLIEKLFESGFSQTEIEKICYKNFLRIFKATL